MTWQTARVRARYPWKILTLPAVRPAPLQVRDELDLVAAIVQFFIVDRRALLAVRRAFNQENRAARLDPKCLRDNLVRQHCFEPVLRRKEWRVVLLFEQREDW